MIYTKYRHVPTRVNGQIHVVLLLVNTVVLDGSSGSGIDYFCVKKYSRYHIDCFT